MVVKSFKSLGFIMVLIGFSYVAILCKDVLANNLEGPVFADVIRIIDGDTIIVRAKIWLNQNLETAVRLRDVDAPELKGKCEEEIALALIAKKFVESQIGEQVFLYDISLDKYGGRVVAKVGFFDKNTGERKDLSEELLKQKLAMPYGGGSKKSWCGVLF